MSGISDAEPYFRKSIVGPLLKVVSVRPAWIATSNRFSHLFSEAVQSSGWTVREFGWGWDALFAPRVILMHWPDELFGAKGAIANAKAFVKIAMLQAARRFGGVRLVWMVHETRPHDVGQATPWVTRAFLNALDGAIYLSQASKLAAEADLPELRKTPSLITRHGDYRQDMERPPEARRSPAGPVRLMYFGQIRPYKNLDGLIRAASALSPDEISVRIVGWSKDPAFTRSLAALAADASAVTLDIRDALVPQIELEEALDDSDGVVLPYRNILNSGAALFALSRNRPVLAPRLGSLPDLQSEIGADWVDIFDGDITTDSLRKFAAQLRASDARVADLSRYEWTAIGATIGQFLDQLSLKTGQSQVRSAEPGVARP